MRRKNQQLTQDEAIGILLKATSGVLALHCDNVYPYAVPVSYVYNNGRLYFHSALVGHKIDAIKSCARASFCVVGQDDVIPEKYTTLYRSVIAFGQIHIVDNESEKLRVARMLGNRYNPTTTKPCKKNCSMASTEWQSCVSTLSISPEKNPLSWFEQKLPERFSATTPHTSRTHYRPSFTQIRGHTTQ